MVSDFCKEVVLKVSSNCQIIVQITCLRILLYPSRLTEDDAARIREDDAGVIWL